MSLLGGSASFEDLARETFREVGERLQQMETDVGKLAAEQRQHSLTQQQIERVVGDFKNSHATIQAAMDKLTAELEHHQEKQQELLTWKARIETMQESLSDQFDRLSRQFDSVIGRSNVTAVGSIEGGNQSIGGDQNVRD